jgi:HEAT repeat protein
VVELSHRTLTSDADHSVTPRTRENWVWRGMVMANKATAAKGFWAARVLFAACFIWLTFGSSAAFPQTVQDQAWEVLYAGINEHNTTKRAAAVGALGLLQGDPRAVESAEKALGDKKPAVRAAGATALGQLDSRSSIPLLRVAATDKDNRVFYAAADSLILLGDPAGYDAYYDQLTGERKSGEGMVADKKKLITDPRAMVILGVGVGIGYAPYAGYGWMLWKELSKDYASPMRIKALKKLENDPDSRISKGLLKAASDKHWTVRVAALFAIARHDDPSLIGPITPYMADKKAPVRYTAAAAILRLSALVPTDDTPQPGNEEMKTQVPTSEK